MFLLTGYHPDCDLYRRAGIRLHRETMSPEFNPETFETNVPGIFLAGGAICGRDTSNIFIENGRFHGETIIKTIAARRASGAVVSLERRDRRMTRERVQIQPPSVRAETINVIKAAVAIVVDRRRVHFPAVVWLPNHPIQSGQSQLACCRIRS